MDNNAYVQLPTAYRSLSRPSSALDAKAFPLRSFQLDLAAHIVRLLVLTRIMQASDLVHCSICVTLLKSSTIKLCYLSVACSQFLACFTVQFSRCSSNLLQGQIEMLALLDKHFNPISIGGGYRIRTGDPLLAKQVLYQLS